MDCDMVRVIRGSESKGERRAMEGIIDTEQGKRHEGSRTCRLKKILRREWQR